MPNKTRTWWENSSRDELHHRQNQLLQRFLTERVVPFAAYYRKLFADNGIDAEDIKTTDDLTRLPFTSKRNLENPKDFVIIPDEAALKRQWSTIKRAIKRGPSRAKTELEEELRPILLTSTTGRSSAPVPFLYTKQDLANLEVSGRRMMELCQSNPTWRHINAFPFAPHLAFWQAHYASLGFNTFMIATGGGHSILLAGVNLALLDNSDFIF